MFGHRITKWEEDGLIGAFGARAIVDSGRHTDYYSRLDFVYDRQSVVGTEFGKKAIIHLVNENEVMLLLQKWVKEHSHSYESEKVYSLWHDGEGEDSNPLEMLFRFSGGYCYIRFGLRAPYQGETCDDYDAFTAKGCPESEKVWTRKGFVPLGTKVQTYFKNGDLCEGEVATYAYLGCWLYMLSLTHKKAIDTVSENGRDNYGNTWSILSNLMSGEVDRKNPNLSEVNVPLNKVQKITEEV